MVSSELYSVPGELTPGRRLGTSTRLGTSSPAVGRVAAISIRTACGSTRCAAVPVLSASKHRDQAGTRLVVSTSTSVTVSLPNCSVQACRTTTGQSLDRLALPPASLFTKCLFKLSGGQGVKSKGSVTIEMTVGLLSAQVLTQIEKPPAFGGGLFGYPVGPVSRLP